MTTRSRRHGYTLLIALVVAASSVALSGPPAGAPPVVPLDAVAPGTVTNPGLPATCGLRVMMVVDSSGSIGASGPQVTGAISAFLDPLQDTGSEVGIIDFDTRVNTVVPYTPVTPATIAGEFQDFIDSYTVGGGTNWAAALDRARTEAGGPPDLVLFLTDGEPTYRGAWGGNPLAGDGSTLTLANINDAAGRADALKIGGGTASDPDTHVFLVGVGVALSGATGLRLQAIQAVSGNQEFTGPGGAVPIGQADYALIPDFADLAAAFRSLVFSFCGPSVTVTKEVDAGDGRGFVPAEGYGFTGEVTAVNGGTTDTFQWKLPTAGPPGVSPPDAQSTTTGPNGSATFQWSPGTNDVPQPWSSTFTLAEDGPPPGSELVGTSCTIRDPESETETTLEFAPADPVQFGVPAGGIATCIVRNVRVAEVRVRKSWTDATAGDTADLSVSGGGQAAQATSTAPTGDLDDTVNTATITVPVGTEVTLAETLTYAAPYGRGLTCNGTPVEPRVDSDDGSAATLEADLVVPDSPDGIVDCVFTNAGQALLVLHKAWTGVHSTQVHEVALTVDAGAGRTATGSSRSDGSVDDAASLAVAPGDTVALREEFLAGAPGLHDIDLTCTGNAGTFTYEPGALEGQVEIVPADIGQRIDCVFTNGDPTAFVVVEKALTPPLDPGRFDLRIQGQVVVAAAADGDSNDDAPHLVVLPADGTTTVTIGEAPTDDTDAANFASAVTCVDGTGAPIVVTGPASGASFEIGLDHRGDTIRCTFTNERRSAQLQLLKQWIGPPDPAVVAVLGAASGSADMDFAPVPNDGAGPHLAVTIGVLAGETVTLAERLPAGVADAFDVSLSCDGVPVPLLPPTPAHRDSPAGPSDEPPDFVDRRGLFDVPAEPPGTIQCTFVDATPSATLTVQKTWVGGVAGDTADLTVAGGVDPGGPVTAAATGVPGEETSPDTVTVTAFAGEELTIAEELGAGNDGTYATDLSCDQPGLTAGADGTSGTYVVPDAPVPVTCTFTNARVGTASVTKHVEQAPPDLAWSFALDIAPLPPGAESPQVVSGTGDGTAGVTFDGLVPGVAYTLAEATVDGWEQGAFTCEVLHLDGTTTPAGATFTVGPVMP